MPAFFEVPHLALLAGGFSTLVVCLLLVTTKHWHGRLTMDTMSGVQKFHTEPTPRVGGIPILVGLVVAWYFAPPAVANILGLMLLAGLPAFVFGLTEDMTKRVGVRERLWATIASGALACYLNGGGLNRLDVWGLDALMLYWPISVAFTAFAVGGVANAVNIIDGFNGLAGGAILISLSALGIMAYSAGDSDLAKLCFILAGVTGGFLVVNFPLGKIFLGDGGAYLMGFLVAWTAVLLLVRNPSVSVWAPLLACGYPVIEVGYSVWRRKLHDMHPGSPDRLHFHSLVKVRIIMRYYRHWRPVYRNSIVSPLIWCFAVVPAALGAVFYRSTPWLLASALASAVLYYVLYRRLERRSKVRSHISDDYPHPYMARRRFKETPFKHSTSPKTEVLSPKPSQISQPSQPSDGNSNLKQSHAYASTPHA